jgi:CubicO group peptidase (beta-lactamase class C family)
MTIQNLFTPLKRSLVICFVLLPTSALAQVRDLEPRLSEVLAKAEALAPLETVLVSVDGELVAQSGYRGNSVSDPTNIKSASKSIISALVGIAIERGLLKGVDQPIAELLADELPDDPDSALNEITLGHLLSMQAGLARTSGPNYGAWVASPNWVRFVLAQPFEDSPGGAMLYSTGSTHLLSAILTRIGDQSTLELAEDWLSPLEDFSITSWDRDPQGIYFGGNQMAMSPLSLLSIGELYCNEGVTASGERVISEDWIAQSWEPQTKSRFTGDAYGYGWFQREITGQNVHYGWGYGGQMLYVVPALELTVVMTSDENSPSARSGHRDDLHQLLGEIIEAVVTSAE